MILELRLEENVIQEVISNPNVPFLALPIKAGTRAALCQSQRKGLASFGNVSPVFFHQTRRKNQSYESFEKLGISTKE